MNTNYPKREVEKEKAEIPSVGPNQDAHRLYIRVDGKIFEVWLGTERLSGWGKSRDEAVANAVLVLEAALDTLQGGPTLEC